MRFSILGPVEITTDAGPLPVKNRRERFVLALLLLNADRLTPTDRIIDALWEEPPPTARAQLHNVIASLRRRLRAEAGELIATRPLGYEFRLGDHELDLMEFRRLVVQGRQAVMEHDPGRAADVLDAALALWRGPALSDVDEKLAREPQRKLNDERAAAAEDLLKARLELGQPDDVLRLLPALIEDHPYRERLYEMQMRALAATGRRADALETYRQAYRRLGDDLGVEPGPALRELEQQVLQGVDIAPTAPTAVTPRQLPAMLTTLTGRDKLVKEVSEALGHEAPGPTTALLVGPGGIGKTSLATTVGHQLSDRFPDGQLYADLRGAHSDAAEPHDVLGAFLRALGVPGSALPDNVDERASLYRSLLADKHLLVMLDDAGDEHQVRPLLPGAAGCSVIVTSRQRLSALVDTTRWTVPGLQPDAAVDLVSRIIGPDRVQVEPEAAASVVAACGHLPLAVSIAAARLAAHEEWSLAEFTDRLTDERRRLDELRLGDLDVRASIALSYQALDSSHQRLFRRLGLFPASDLPSWVAHEVNDALSSREVEVALDRLSDAHLIEPLGRDRVGQTRFRLHDLVAEYAHERAHAEETESDRSDVVSRVLSGWLALASEADEHIPHGMAQVSEGLTVPVLPSDALPPGPDTADSWFEIESFNLAEAVAQACRVNSADLAGGLAIRLFGYGSLYAHHEDQRRILRAACDCVRESGRDDLLDRVLRLLFNCVVDTASPAELEDIAAESLAVARRLGDPRSYARACLWTGATMLRHGRVAQADDWLRKGLTAAEACDDALLHSGLLDAIASAHVDAGRVDEALAPMKRSLDIERRRGRSHQVAISQHNYGEILLANAQYTEAEAALNESIRLAVEFGDPVLGAYSECALAEVDMERGDWPKAAQRLEHARRTHDAARVADGLAYVDRALGDLALSTGEPTDAIGHFGRAHRTWESLGVPIYSARMLARLELAHRAAGEPDAAEEHRRGWRSILDDLGLDEACLLLPPFLTKGQ